MNQDYLLNDIINIPGLAYVPNYISSEYEEKLLKLIDIQQWNLDLKRRTQHYGYKYDYMARSVDASYYLGQMPYWVDELCSKVHRDTIFIDKPNQVIINEYLPGQGIAPHVDCVPCFGDAICSLGLASGCMIDMTNGHVKKSIYFEPRSLLILKGDARYKWKHGIAARKSDNRVKRQRRISLTFRQVIL
ncbi:MAG: alpha-ketoglutarate-dependent dioxygenase AlkB [Alphaproteobacteria bacterium 40-19]|nr:MAG: alpha-ketoglutarate-dependent dioxygenase AlkB [Alphaproteobacteria bacterium 40-19]